MAKTGRKAPKVKQPAVPQPPAILPSVWVLSRQALRVLRQNWKIFLGICGIYALLSLFLVQRVAELLNISSLQTLIGSSTDRLTSGILTFSWLLSGTGTAEPAASGVQEIIILLVASLAIVWVLRHVWSGTAVRIRDAFYKGMYPLVPVAIVLMVVAAQLLPVLFGLGIYNVILTYGVASNLFLRLVWTVPVLALGLLSLYLVASTVIALYVAMLPDMSPFKALKSARGLVQYRRWAVARKLLFLPVGLLVIAGVILAPVLLLVPLLAPWLVFIIGIMYLPIVHSYLYCLYRELLV